MTARNLAASFPDKSDSERTAISRKFYRNFADYIVESVKLLHISDSEMCRRMEFVNVSEMDRLTAQGKSIAIYFSHCGNWEWAPSVTLHASQSPGIRYCQVYRPLKDRVMDRIMLRIRSRFGSCSLPKATVMRSLLRFRKDGLCTVTGFMSDQKPSHGDPTFHVRFLHRDTAFITGTETLARKMGMAVIYWDMEKISRGHYRITCRHMSDNAAETEPGQLTGLYADLLQETILRNPPIWLWTHNRWKKINNAAQQ